MYWHTQNRRPKCRYQILHRRIDGKVDSFSICVNHVLIPANAPQCRKFSNPHLLLSENKLMIKEWWLCSSQKPTHTNLNIYRKKTLAISVIFRIIHLSACVKGNKHIKTLEHTNTYTKRTRWLSQSHMRAINGSYNPWKSCLLIKLLGRTHSFLFCDRHAYKFPRSRRECRRYLFYDVVHGGFTHATKIGRHLFKERVDNGEFSK